MSYTVNLAIFPPWKAPVPTETIGTFATHSEASAAGALALSPIAERELIAINAGLHPARQSSEGSTIASILVPDEAVHGYVVYDANGAEVGNWTTLDIAVERVDKV